VGSWWDMSGFGGAAKGRFKGWKRSVKEKIFDSIKLAKNF